MPVARKVCPLSPLQRPSSPFSVNHSPSTVTMLRLVGLIFEIDSPDTALTADAGYRNRGVEFAPDSSLEEAGFEKHPHALRRITRKQRGLGKLETFNSRRARSA